MEEGWKTKIRFESRNWSKSSKTQENFATLNKRLLHVTSGLGFVAEFLAVSHTLHTCMTDIAVQV